MPTRRGSLPMSWALERESDFRAMLAEFGPVVIWFNGQSAETLQTPTSNAKPTSPTNFMLNRDATFSILLSEWQRLGLALRSRFTQAASTFEVVRSRIDPSDPIVDFDVIRPQ